MIRQNWTFGQNIAELTWKLQMKKKRWCIIGVGVVHYTTFLCYPPVSSGGGSSVLHCTMSARIVLPRTPPMSASRQRKSCSTLIFRTFSDIFPIFPSTILIFILRKLFLQKLLTLFTFPSILGETSYYLPPSRPLVSIKQEIPVLTTMDALLTS